MNLLIICLLCDSFLNMWSFWKTFHVGIVSTMLHTWTIVAIETACFGMATCRCICHWSIAVCCKSKWTFCNCQRRSLTLSCRRRPIADCLCLGCQFDVWLDVCQIRSWENIFWFRMSFGQLVQFDGRELVIEEAFEFHSQSLFLINCGHRWSSRFGFFLGFACSSIELL